MCPVTTEGYNDKNLFGVRLCFPYLEMEKNDRIWTWFQKAFFYNVSGKLVNFSKNKKIYILKTKTTS